MRKKIFTTIILLIGIIISINAQKNRATLYLRNGEILKGLANVTIDNKIKFRKDRKGKKQTFDCKSVNKIKINTNGSTNEYIYKLVEDDDYEARPKLMTLITKGKLDLYKINISGSYYTTMGGAGGSFGFGGVGMTHSYSINNYYIGKKDSDFVERFTSTDSLFDKNFKKAASEYFKDCPKLVKMIEDKTLKKNDLEEIVEIYNNKCD